MFIIKKLIFKDLKFEIIIYFFINFLVIKKSIINLNFSIFKFKYINLIIKN